MGTLTGRLIKFTVKWEYELGPVLAQWNIPLYKQTKKKLIKRLFHSTVSFIICMSNMYLINSLSLSEKPWSKQTTDWTGTVIDKK